MNPIDEVIREAREALRARREQQTQSKQRTACSKMNYLSPLRDPRHSDVTSRDPEKDEKFTPPFPTSILQTIKIPSTEMLKQPPKTVFKISESSRMPDKTDTLAAKFARRPTRLPSLHSQKPNQQARMVSNVMYQQLSGRRSTSNLIPNATQPIKPVFQRTFPTKTDHITEQASTNYDPECLTNFRQTHLSFSRQGIISKTGKDPMFTNRKSNLCKSGPNHTSKSGPNYLTKCKPNNLFKSGQNHLSEDDQSHSLKMTKLRLKKIAQNQFFCGAQNYLKPERDNLVNTRQGYLIEDNRSPCLARCFSSNILPYIAFDEANYHGTINRSSNHTQNQHFTSVHSPSSSVERDRSPIISRHCLSNISNDKRVLVSEKSRIPQIRQSRLLKEQNRLENATVSKIPTIATTRALPPIRLARDSSEDQSGDEDIGPDTKQLMMPNRFTVSAPDVMCDCARKALCNRLSPSSSWKIGMKVPHLERRMDEVVGIIYKQKNKDKRPRRLKTLVEKAREEKSHRRRIVTPEALRIAKERYMDKTQRALMTLLSTTEPKTQNVPDTVQARFLRTEKLYKRWMI